MAFDPIPLILQGIVVTTIGLLVYQTGHRWFKGMGSNQFQSKEFAQILVVSFLLFTGMVSGPLLDAIQTGVSGYTAIQQWGIVIIASRILVNMMVPEWRFNDETTLLMLIGGLLMFFSPAFIG